MFDITHNAEITPHNAENIPYKAKNIPYKAENTKKSLVDILSDL